MSAKKTITDPWRDRVDSGNWVAITAEVNEYGGALLPQLLRAAETTQIRALYKQNELFRSTINMGRHRFSEWLQMCHDAGQTKSTAILLRYGEKDWNALHRDLYGDLVFPLQVVVNLNEPGVDHTGGEFLLLEQRPRAQPRGTATLLPHGRGYLLTSRDRPVESARGWSAAPVRHSVSAIRSGERHTLALVFHDAG